MSTQVLLALADMELFKGMSEDQVGQVTNALVAEIESDPQLKQRLTDAISQSAAELMARKIGNSADLRS
jgi:hypothetical protein